jgi:hypothetical protein
MSPSHRHHRGGGAAHRRRPRAHDRAEAHRWPGAGHEGGQPGTARDRAGRQADAGTGAERARGTRGPHGPRRGQEVLPHSPARPELRGAVHRAEDVRDRHQSHRPSGAVSARRQDRAVRRRGRRQDGDHHGADPQHRHAPRGRVGVRRRRRTHARGQRPLAGDAGVRRHRPERLAQIQVRSHLRPDDRAAGRAPAGRTDRTNRSRVLPRRGRPGRAPVHRQHLPLHAGGLGSLGACSAACLRRWVTSPTWPPRWANCRSGSRPPRKVRSPPCRRSTCRPTTTPIRRRRPPSRTWTRPPSFRGPSPSWASTRPSTRWPPRRGSSTRASSARSTTRRRSRSSRSSSATRTCKTSSPSWASTSSPTRTSSSWRAPARSSASSRSPSTWPSSSPAARAST